MFDYLVQNYVTAAVSVASILIFLQTIKKLVDQQLKSTVLKSLIQYKPKKVPGIIWYAAAWMLGIGSAFLSPLKCEEWRCWANAALIHGSLALALYPVTKRIVGKVQDIFVGAN